MNKFYIPLMVLLIIIIIGCIKQAENNNDLSIEEKDTAISSYEESKNIIEKEYVCSDGSVVSNPTLCQKKTNVSSVKNAEETLKEYISLRSYMGVTELLNNLYIRKDLATGYVLDSLTEDIIYYQEIQNFFLESSSLCDELITKYGSNLSCNHGDFLEDMILSIEILHLEIIEETSDITKIQVTYKSMHSITSLTNITEQESVYILRNVDGTWKIEDIIDEKGELLSETYKIEDIKKRNSEIFQKNYETMEMLKSAKSTLELQQEQSKYETEKSIEESEQFWDEFCDSRTTELARNELLRTYNRNSKSVTGNGEILKIYKEMTTYKVLIRQCPNSYGYDLGLYFSDMDGKLDNATKKKLLSYKIGDEILYTASGFSLDLIDKVWATGTILDI